MENLPHSYQVTASAGPEDHVTVLSGALPPLEVAPPRQFDGPGDKWSPEELLMAAVANCLILSFRVTAKASRLDWSSIRVDSNGSLDKSESGIRITTITSRVSLKIASGESAEKAEKLLQKAEKNCFISNSLNCDIVLECDISNGSDPG